MKRKALAIAFIIVIAVSVATLLLHNQISDQQNQINKLQEQNEELQNQKSEQQDQIGKLQNQNTVLQDKLNEKYSASPVQIMTVKMTGWAPIGGLTIGSQVKVTVHNNGSIDISGLTLTVRLLNNNTEVGDGYVQEIDGLRAGERREISGNILYGLGTTFEIESRVKLGDVVLYEHIGASS